MATEDPVIITRSGMFIPSYFEEIEGYVENGISVEDFVYPAHSINPTGQAGGATVDNTTLPGTLIFADAQTQSCAVTLYLTHHYKPGTDLAPHIHWCKATSAAGNVKWTLDYRIVKKNTAAASAVTLNATGLDASTTDTNLALKHLETNFPNIPGTGLNPSDVIICILKRIGADAADTYAGAAHLMQLDFHYQINPYI